MMSSSSDSVQVPSGSGEKRVSAKGSARHHQGFSNLFIT